MEDLDDEAGLGFPEGGGWWLWPSSPRGAWQDGGGTGGRRVRRRRMGGAVRGGWRVRRRYAAGGIVVHGDKVGGAGGESWPRGLPIGDPPPIPIHDDAIDISGEYFNLSHPIIEKVDVAHKVDFPKGPALHTLDDLLTDVRTEDGEEESVASRGCPGTATSATSPRRNTRRALANPACCGGPWIHATEGGTMRSQPSWKGASDGWTMWGHRIHGWEILLGTRSNGL
ncbi:unnamed protein product [Urochloa humidicola]